MNVVIVSPEMVGPFKNGGIGTFTTHFARLLSKHTSDTVTIVYVGPLMQDIHEWIGLYREYGVKVIVVPQVRDAVFGTPGMGNEDFVQRAYAASKFIPDDADIIYLQENGATGFLAVRQNRLLPASSRTFVTMMHGSRDWVLEAMGLIYDRGYEDLSISYGERYTVHYSDFVVANSHYLLDWVRRFHWHLPPDERVRVLKLPYLPDEKLLNNQVTHAPQFNRVIFFGRLETRKGFEVFVYALLRLAQQFKMGQLPPLKEIVFLGKDGSHQFETARNAARLLEEKGFTTTIINSMDTFSGQQYLAANAADSLVVIPSLVEALGYTAIETSLIQGVNVICSRVGGIPEVYGDEPLSHLFEPTIEGLASKLETVLQQGPQPQRIPPYDYHTVNQAWLRFHQTVAEHAQMQRQTPRKPSAPPQQPIIDVYVYHGGNHRNGSSSFETLSQQTMPLLRVNIIDDGSSPASNSDELYVFAKRHSHWRLVSGNHYRGVAASLNETVASSQSSYVCFLSSNQLVEPNALETLYESIIYSDTDCLTSWTLEFEPGSQINSKNNPSPFLIPRRIHLPLGNCPEAGLFGNCFGNGILLIKHSVFDAIGGFNPQLRVTNLALHLYELLTRVVLWGYSLDVVPDFLVLQPFDATIPTLEEAFQTERLIHKHYQDKLQNIGMSYLVSWMYASHLAIWFQRTRQTDLQDLKPLESYYRAVVAERLPFFEVNNSFREEETITYENLKDTRWLSERIPWRKLVGTLLRKLYK